MSNRSQRESREEREIRQAFGAFLSSRLGQESITFRKEPTDPPDYWFNIGGDEYAVEATTVGNYVHSNRKRVPGRAHLGMAEQLQAKLRKICDDTGILSGHYVVTFAQPIGPRADRKYILQEALAYIRNTRHLDQGDEHEIRLPDEVQEPRSGRLVAHIMKGLRQPDLVEVLRPPQAAWVESEAECATVELQRVITDKAGKLGNRDVAKPWVLLVLHDNPFVEHTFYKQRALLLVGADQFHAIFIAKRTGRGQGKNGYVLSGPWAE